jgi:hypothetical protein
MDRCYCNDRFARQEFTVYLSDVAVTAANHSFVRFHVRNEGY